MTTHRTGRLWAVLMAGGSGTRFWPMSRKALPKQFLKILSKRSLLEETVSTFGHVIPRSRIWVMTQRDKVSKVVKTLGISKARVIGEPVGRNTAPCAVLAAALIHREDPEAVMALLPADQRIGNPRLFQGFLKEAARVAGRYGMPVTMGVMPKEPHTGFGYLEKGARFGHVGPFAVYRLMRFHEKPSLVKARRFLKSGRFLWNCGIFVWRADRLLEAARRYQPKIWRLALKIAKAGGGQTALGRFFPLMPSISIDYGLMEKMRGKILTIPADPHWSDLGGWLSVAALLPKDDDSNAVLGKAVILEGSGNLVQANDRLVALIGMKDLVVVDTKDALLICPKQKTESIRRIVKELDRRKWHTYL